MLGSKDETRQEVVQALGYDDHDKAHTELSSALSAVQNTGVASAAARLFVQVQGLKLKKLNSKLHEFCIFNTNQTRIKLDSN